MGKITVELYLSTFGTTLHRLNHPKVDGGNLFKLLCQLVALEQVKN